MMEQAASTNFGSPRPPQSGASGMSVDKLQQLKMTIQKLYEMNDAQREAYLQGVSGENSFSIPY